MTGVTTTLRGTKFKFDDTEYTTKMLGYYQTRNAATVLTAVIILRECGVVIPESAVRDGIASATWSARFEILSDEPLVIYDGGHNPQGIRGAVENIRGYLSPLTEDGRVVLLMGVMADKEHLTMIRDLSEIASHAFCVMPNNARSLGSADLSGEFASFGTPADYFDELECGVIAAIQTAEREARPLVCLGSLYMYADVKRAVKKYIKN